MVLEAEEAAASESQTKANGFVRCWQEKKGTQLIS